MSTANKRFWIVSSNRWNSAVTEYALSSAMALGEAGHDVVFTPLMASPAHKRAIAMGLNYQPLTAFSFQNLWQFRGVAAAAKPDNLLLMGGPETFLSKFVGGKKFRLWGEAKPALYLSRFRSQFGHRHVKAFITPSQIIRAEVAKHVSQPVAHIVLGIDQRRFHRVETLGGFLQKRPQVVIFGRLDPVKGHLRALRFLSGAFSRWRDHHRRPCLHIVGEPANLDRASLVEQVSQMGLKIGEDVLITCERIADVSALMSQTILGLVPSVGSEAIGRVAQEFLMCGTPIVVSGVGSLNELLFNEEAGASYSAMEKDEEIASLIMSWVDRSLSEGELAKRKRAQQAKKLFSWAQMAQALMEFCEDTQSASR